MENKALQTTMYEFMSRSIDIAQLDNSKIPEAIMLSKTVGHLIKTVVDDSKSKASFRSGDSSDYALNSMLKLNELLQNKDGFLLPYRYYFYIKNVLFTITEQEDREEILKFPIRAFCSKKIGLRLYQQLATHLSKYFPTASEMTYVTGKALDTMWISESLFHLDKYLIKEKLPDINGECAGMTKRVTARQVDIEIRVKQSGNVMPRGTNW